MAQQSYQEAFGKTHDANDIGMTPTDGIAHAPKGVDAAAQEDGTGVPTLVPSHSHSHEASPVLQRDAATQGSWMAYVKTKQFWIAMVLGQSPSPPSSSPSSSN